MAQIKSHTPASTTVTRAIEGTTIWDETVLKYHFATAADESAAEADFPRWRLPRINGVAHLGEEPHDQVPIPIQHLADVAVDVLIRACRAWQQVTRPCVETFCVECIADDAGKLTRHEDAQVEGVTVGHVSSPK